MGNIPSWLGRETNLVVLDLHSNAFTGPLPIELAALDKLQVVRLEDNLLQGTIPSAFGNWTAMNRTYLDHNDFSGTIPESICDLHLFGLVTDCNELECSCCTRCCQGDECKWTGIGASPGKDDRNDLPPPQLDDT
jgi:hypothetical protein